jgi:hypothetical protein
LNKEILKIFGKKTGFSPKVDIKAVFFLENLMLFPTDVMLQTPARFLVEK